MTASLRALLAGAIDYAGLFPPAELPLEQAFTNYLSYRQSPDAWMLGNFIIPVPQLEQLCHLESFLKHELDPVRLTMLGRVSPTLRGLLEGIDGDVKLLAGFCDRFKTLAQTKVLEIRLPDEFHPAYYGHYMLPQCLLQISAHLKDQKLRDWSVVVEPSPSGDWHEAAAGLIQDLAEYKNSQGTGFKLRCGGLDPAAFPTPEKIAFVLGQCRQFKLPLKLTAGLHHPLPRFDPGLGVTMHGFINVFVAATIAYCWAPPQDLLVQILNETEPDFFTFTDQDLRWKDWRVDLNAIREARQKLLASFGSCSFDEPRADLRALGWL